MRFAFSEQQREFAGAVRELLAKECPAVVVREAWTASPDGVIDRERWAALADMGVVGLTVPEPLGGLGLGLVDVVLLLEEAGRAALPEPLAETTAVAVPLLAECGDPDGWLAQIAAGTAVVSVALGAPAGPAPHAQGADLILVQRGETVWAVGPDWAALDPHPSVDRARPMSRVDFDDDDATRVTADGDLVSAAFDRGALAAAAQLIGVAGQLIEMTAEYAKAREQFGRPIGSFQAVKHHLANAHLALEFARPLVYRAAYSVDPLDVSMAKWYAGDAAERVARVAHQVHGAIGYTWEHDLHLWTKRAWTLSAAWGDGRWHRNRLRPAMLGSQRSVTP